MQDTYSSRGGRSFRFTTKDVPTMDISVGFQTTITNRVSLACSKREVLETSHNLYEDSWN